MHSFIQADNKHIEYLLYGETFQGSGELQWIVEEGFPFHSSKSKLDPHVPILLSNSIGLADICRLQVIKDGFSIIGLFSGDTRVMQYCIML